MADATVGVIANPMSGRDIRRLVASASVFPNAEKASIVVRLTAAAGAFGVGRVLVSTDTTTAPRFAQYQAKIDRELSVIRLTGRNGD